MSDNERLVLTIPEAARLLRISRNLAYELAAQGRLPHIRLGRRVLIPREGLEGWVVQQAGLGGAPSPKEPPLPLTQHVSLRYRALERRAGHGDSEHPKHR